MKLSEAVSRYLSTQEKIEALKAELKGLEQEIIAMCPVPKIVRVYGYFDGEYQDRTYLVQNLTVTGLYIQQFEEAE